MKNQAVFHWSGGKDSTLALHYALQDPSITVRYLLTTVNKAYRRIAIHGVRVELLKQQAESIGIPLIIVELPELPSMKDYEAIMQSAMRELQGKGITHAIFGDIFLEDLKLYREKKMAEAGMQCIFPIWRKDTKQLLGEFLELGYQTILVCVQDRLKNFCGRVIDTDFIDELPTDVDPCGENGEFHTFTYAGPIFKQSIDFAQGEQVYRTFPNPKAEEAPIGLWYQDLLACESLKLA